MIFDYDGNGTLDWDEYRVVLALLQLSTEDLMVVFSMLDRDGSKTIDEVTTGRCLLFPHRVPMAAAPALPSYRPQSEFTAVMNALMDSARATQKVTRPGLRTTPSSTPAAEDGTYRPALLAHLFGANGDWWQLAWPAPPRPRSRTSAEAPLDALREEAAPVPRVPVLPLPPPPRAPGPRVQVGTSRLFFPRNRKEAAARRSLGCGRSSPACRHYDQDGSNTISARDFALSIVAPGPLRDIDRLCAAVDAMPTELCRRQITREEFLVMADISREASRLEPPTCLPGPVPSPSP